MKKKARLPRWRRILWVLLALNIILLLFALFDQGIWYVIASFLWSMGILIFQAKMIRESQKTFWKNFPEDNQVIEKRPEERYYN